VTKIYFELVTFLTPRVHLCDAVEAVSNLIRNLLQELRASMNCDMGEMRKRLTMALRNLMPCLFANIACGGPAGGRPQTMEATIEPGTKT